MNRLLDTLRNLGTWKITNYHLTEIWCKTKIRYVLRYILRTLVGKLIWILIIVGILVFKWVIRIILGVEMVIIGIKNSPSLLIER